MVSIFCLWRIIILLDCSNAVGGVWLSVSPFFHSGISTNIKVVQHVLDKTDKRIYKFNQNTFIATHATTTHSDDVHLPTHWYITKKFYYRISAFYLLLLSMRQNIIINQSWNRMSIKSEHRESVQSHSVDQKFIMWDHTVQIIISNAVLSTN